MLARFSPMSRGPVAPRLAFDRDGLLDELKKALAERALNAEIDHHLDAGEGDGNRRNGYGRKTVLTGTGKIAGDIPRDRLSRFDPQLIAKYQRRFTGFDGGYTAITDFLRTARPPATPPFEVCFETPPGN